MTFRERFLNWKETGVSPYKAGRLKEFDEGKNVSEQESAPVIQDRASILDYLSSIEQDFYTHRTPMFDKGKDQTSYRYTFDEIPKVDQNAGLSYTNYYDKLTGDVFMDTKNQAVPAFNSGKSFYNDTVDYIIGHEGFMEYAGDIGDGKISIGSGLTDPKWTKKGRITREENRRAVMEEVQNRERRLSKTIPNWNSLSGRTKKAIISYDYNYPISQKTSPRFLQKMKAGDWVGAAREMNAGENMEKFSKGLRKRRESERNEFLSGFSDDQLARRPQIRDTQTISTDVIKRSPVAIPQEKTIRRVGSTRNEFNPNIPRSISYGSSSEALHLPNRPNIPQMLDLLKQRFEGLNLRIPTVDRNVRKK